VPKADLPSGALYRLLAEHPSSGEDWPRNGCAMGEAIYASASERHDEIFARATRLFIPTLLRAAHLSSDQMVLDVATGTGAAARLAAEVVGPTGSVVAGDVSPTMLEAARRNLAGTPVTLELLDAQALPYPESRFDAVICQLGLMFFTDPGRGLLEFHRVLRQRRVGRRKRHHDAGTFALRPYRRRHSSRHSRERGKAKPLVLDSDSRPPTFVIRWCRLP
jgi:SAM-dependent methyltransferase